MKVIKLLIIVLVLGNIGTAHAQTTVPPMSDEQAFQIVKYGSPDDVRNLIQSGYDVNKTFHCYTLLTTAVNSAVYGINPRKHPTYALEKVKLLVNAGADVNQIPCPDFSMSALHSAVNLPSLILDMERDVMSITDNNIKNNIGECNFPGIVSKPCGQITPEEREKIRIAVKHAIQVTHKTFSQYFIRIIDFLVKNGGNINLKAGMYGSAPFHHAAANPQEISLEPLEYLIKAGADINIQDNMGNTPLFWAYSVKNDKAVAKLIEAGANKNIKNNENAFYNEVKAVRERIYSKEPGKFELETY